MIIPRSLSVQQRQHIIISFSHQGPSVLPRSRVSFKERNAQQLCVKATLDLIKAQNWEYDRCKDFYAFLYVLSLFFCMFISNIMYNCKYTNGTVRLLCIVYDEQWFNFPPCCQQPELPAHGEEWDMAGKGYSLMSNHVVPVDVSNTRWQYRATVVHHVCCRVRNSNSWIILLVKGSLFRVTSQGVVEGKYSK